MTSKPLSSHPTISGGERARQGGGRSVRRGVSQILPPLGAVACGGTIGRAEMPARSPNLAFWLLPACLLLCLAGCEPCPAYAEPAYTDEQVANAIYLAEGGAKTRYPYGVISVNTHSDPAYAKKIVLNSIARSRERWRKAGRPVDWLAYFASRWCPVGAENDPTGLNSNWLRNVRAILSNNDTK